MRKKLKLGLLAGVFLMTAFAFAENGGQLQPSPTVVAAIGHVAAAMTLPEALATQVSAAALPEAPATPAAVAAPAPAPLKKALGITYGMDERFRSDNYNNFNDLTNAQNDENRFLKFRTRIFMNVNLSKDVDGFIRLANESYKRYYASSPVFGTASVEEPWQAGELWIDNAYLDFKKLPGLPNVALRVGRQDILKGDQFVIFDGTPGDGPRSGYFNAFDLAYTRGQRKFELIGTWNPRSDDFFPEVNGNNPPGFNFSGNCLPAGTTHFTGTYVPCATRVGSFPVDVNDWNEQGIIGYYTDRSHKNFDIDAYYIFKKEYGESLINTSVTGPAFDSYAGGVNNYQWQPDRHLSAFGGRLVYRFPMDTVAHTEWIYEAGTQDAMTTTNDPAFAAVNGGLGYPQVDIRAWGSQGFATKYFPKVKTQPYVRVVYELMSGQDPKNLKTDTAWDPLFGRWPRENPLPNPDGYGYYYPSFSLGGAYPVMKEVDSLSPDYETNKKLIGVEAGFTPLHGKVRKLELIAAYQHAGAFHPFATNPVHYSSPGVSLPGTVGFPVGFFGTGTTRYDLAKAQAYLILSKTLSTNIRIEKFYPGDFYTPAYRSNSTFFRWEVLYSYSGFLPFKKVPKV